MISIRFRWFLPIGAGTTLPFELHLAYLLSAYIPLKSINLTKEILSSAGWAVGCFLSQLVSVFEKETSKLPYLHHVCGRKARNGSLHAYRGEYKDLSASLLGRATGVKFDIEALSIVV